MVGSRRKCLCTQNMHQKMFIKIVSILRIVPICAILISGVKLERKACKSSFKIYVRRNPARECSEKQTNKKDNNNNKFGYGLNASLLVFK